MSDTPRTDAFEDSVDRSINWWDFARELERENAALRNSQCTTWHLEKLEAENAALREQIAKFNHPAHLHSHCLRYLTDAQVAHLFGERMTEIQNNRESLRAENAKLRRWHEEVVIEKDDAQRALTNAKAENAALLEALSELAESVMARGLQGEEPTAPAVLRVFKAYTQAFKLLRKEAQP